MESQVCQDWTVHLVLKEILDMTVRMEQLDHKVRWDYQVYQERMVSMVWMESMDSQVHRDPQE